MQLGLIAAQLMRNRTGPLLIVLQLALTLAIISNAIDLIGNRLASAQRPSGVIDEERLLTERFIRNSNTPLQPLIERDLHSLRSIPGVEAVSVVNQVPLGMSGWNTTVTASQATGAASHSAGMYFDDGSLVDTLGLRLIEGRTLSVDEVQVQDDDRRQLSGAVVVSRALAEALFPEASSWVGQTFYDGSGSDANAFRIVGVVEQLITPWAQNSAAAHYSMLLPVLNLNSYNYYVVRVGAGEIDNVRGKMAERVLANDAQRVSSGERSIAELRERRFRAEHSLAWLLVAVTGLLLLDTASGIVGMASLWVNQRRRQIGIRRALGATRRDILAHFLGENLLISAVGLTAGAFCAYALNGLLMRELGAQRLDGLSVLLNMLALLLLGQLATLGPALRAAAVSPTVATRSV